MANLDASVMPIRLVIENISKSEQKIVIPSTNGRYIIYPGDILKLKVNDSAELLYYLNQRYDIFKMSVENMSSSITITDQTDLNSLINDIDTKLAGKVDKTGDEINGNLRINGYLLLQNELMCTGIEITLPVNATSDWDFEEIQYSFHRHSVSFHTTQDGIEFRIMLKVNVVLTTSFGTVAWLYDNFDDIAPYIESCVCNYKNGNAYLSLPLISMYKSTMTKDKLLTNAVTFKFMNLA